MVNKENTQLLLGVSSVATPLSRPFTLTSASLPSPSSILRSIWASTGSTYVALLQSCRSANGPRQQDQACDWPNKVSGSFSVNYYNYLQAAEDAGEDY